MKQSLIYIGIAFLSISCESAHFRPESGDLLFQVNKSSAMTDAITASTGDNSNLNFSHVAITVRSNDADSVLEATSNGGVRMVSLKDFLVSSAQTETGTAVVVMRLRDTTGIAKSIQRARSYIGQPYDFTYLPKNGKMYCSELVYESYLLNGGHLFTARPMNFRDAEGNLPEFWAELFAEQGIPVPEGTPGTNPNDLSKESILKEVHRYF